MASYTTRRLHDQRSADIVKWQFWPKSISMGTLMRNDFVQVRMDCQRGAHLSIQMLGAKVEYGEDFDNRRVPGLGLSYLSFDWMDQ